jgi:hypothetical protein
LVQAAGKGTLTPNYSNAVLEVGTLCTMKATAAAGFAFTNWVVSTNWAGGRTTNNATGYCLTRESDEASVRL